MPKKVDDPEIIEVNTTVVNCDGDDTGGLGHPKVYLNLGQEGDTFCPYCDRRFIYKNTKEST